MVPVLVSNERMDKSSTLITINSPDGCSRQYADISYGAKALWAGAGPFTLSQHEAETTYVASREADGWVVANAHAQLGDPIDSDEPLWVGMLRVLLGDHQIGQSHV